MILSPGIAVAPEDKPSLAESTVLDREDKKLHSQLCGEVSDTPAHSPGEEVGE